MDSKIVFLVVFDLFILTHCKPGPFRDPHRPNHGKPPRGRGDWGSQGWDHPWGYHHWDHNYTTRRAATKGTTKPTTEAQESIDTRSPTSTLPQPTIRDIDLRLGEIASTDTTSTLTEYSTPKLHTLILKEDKKDKASVSSASDTEDNKDGSAILDLTPVFRNENIASDTEDSNDSDIDLSPIIRNENVASDTEDSNDSDNLDLSPIIRNENVASDTEDSNDSDNLDLSPIIRNENVTSDTEDSNDSDNLDVSPIIRNENVASDTEDSNDSDNLDVSPIIRNESVTSDTGDSQDDSDEIDLTPGIRNQSRKVESPPNTPDAMDADELDNSMVDVQQENKWHVGIYKRELSKVFIYKYKCGGSLIKADMVISAGHCFWSPVLHQLPSSDFEAAAGKIYREWDDPRDTNAQYTSIKKITITPMHEPCRQPDLAFVKVNPGFIFNSFVKPVCVNFGEVLEYQQLTRGRFATISSSAIIDGAGACQPSEQIHWRSLPYVDVNTCTNNQNMLNRLSNRICAGEAKDETQCESDKGNGLVFFEDKIPYLRGVASFIPTDSFCMKYNTTSYTNLGAVKAKAAERFQILYDMLIFEQCEEFYINKTEAVTPGTKDDDTTEYVVGGFEIQSIGSMAVPGLNGTSAPSLQWHVGVYSKNWSPYMQICGGSLVKPEFVISTAHCFWDSNTGLQSSTRFAVAGGKLYRPWADQHDTYAQQSDVADIIIPVRFRGSATSFQDDIAILRLENPFTYALGVQPVCLDFSMELDKKHLQPGTKGTVAGWGLTAENGVPSQRLNYLEMPYVDLDECFAESEPSFHKYITSDKICAGSQDTGQALCRGDSGGGLVIMDSGTPYLRGLASTAANNDNLCNAYTINAFTHIYSHRSFLRDNIPDVENECNRVYTNKGVKGTDQIRYKPGQDGNSVGITPASGAITGSVGARRDVATRDTPSYSSVPYNHFVCNCNCKS